MQREAEDRESIDYFLVCEKYNGKIEIMEKDKCDELKFYSLDAIIAVGYRVNSKEIVSF